MSQLYAPRGDNSLIAEERRVQVEETDGFEFQRNPVKVFNQESECVIIRGRKIEDDMNETVEEIPTQAQAEPSSTRNDNTEQLKMKSSSVIECTEDDPDIVTEIATASASFVSSREKRLKLSQKVLSDVTEKRPLLSPSKCAYKVIKSREGWSDDELLDPINGDVLFETKRFTRTVVTHKQQKVELIYEKGIYDELKKRWGSDDCIALLQAVHDESEGVTVDEAPRQHSKGIRLTDQPDKSTKTTAGLCCDQ